MPVPQRKASLPSLSEQDIFMILRGIAGSVQLADE
jgi:hypothetical protein